MKPYTKDTKKRFWDIIKKPKKKEDSSIGTVTAVDNSSGIVTISNTPTLYGVDQSSYSTWTTSSVGSIITYTGATPTFIHTSVPTYSLTQDDETLEVTLEEYNLAQKAAFNFIKKKREYKNDFEELINSSGEPKRGEKS